MWGGKKPEIVKDRCPMRSQAPKPSPDASVVKQAWEGLYSKMYGVLYTIFLDHQRSSEMILLLSVTLPFHPEE